MSDLLRNIFIDIRDDHYYMIQRFKSPVDFNLLREIRLHAYFKILTEEKIEQLKKKLEIVKTVDHFASSKKLEGFFIYVDENEK